MLVYEVIAGRRNTYDGLLWQMPMLGLTAQAFLFTIALGSGGRFARITASLLTNRRLSCVVAHHAPVPTDALVDR